MNVALDPRTRGLCYEMLPVPSATIRKAFMTSTRRSFARAHPQRRPCGPRCHGGASSLLRPGSGMAAQRATSAPGGRRERLESDDVAVVEHIVGWPARSERADPLSC